MIGKIRRSFISIGRLLFVVLILIGTFVFAMFQGGLVSWTIFYAVLPFNLYSILLFFYPLTSFSAKRLIKTSYLQSGDRLRATVIIRRKFPFPLLYTAFSDQWIDGEQKIKIEELHTMRVLGWKQQMEWSYEMKDVVRGEFIAPKIRIEVTDFFGWIRKSRVISVQDQILVYPRMVDLDSVSVDSGEGERVATTPFNFMKDTTVVTGVRDYQSGDRMSWIHWKSFAKTQTLMTKEFEERSSKNLSLIFDGRTSTTFEEEITFVASLLKAAMNERLEVHFLPVHRLDPFLDIQSEAQFKAVLMYLAKVQPVHEERVVFSGAMKRQLDQDGMIMMITARLDRQLVDEVQSSGRGRRSIHCFVVIENQADLQDVLVEDMKYATSQGITVHPVMKNQFTHVLKEVMNR